MSLGNKKIYCLSGFMSEENIKKIRQTVEPKGYEVFFYPSDLDIIEKIDEAEIVYASGAVYGDEIAKKAKGLKWFCSVSAGVDAVARPGGLPEGVVLSNGAGAFGLTIAEHLVMVTLMLCRRYPEYDEMIRRHQWDHSLSQKSIYGSRITILGTGDIGSNFAKRIKNFGPSCVIGINRSGVKSSEDFNKVLSIDHLDKVLPNTDILVMCLPGTASTYHLLDERRLGLLPAEAFVINVGRGSSVDEDALAAALNNGRIAAAALDVFEREPLPSDSVLWDVKNLLITPHNSGQMTLKYTRDKNVAMFCEDFENYIAGKPLKYRVNIELGY